MCLLPLLRFRLHDTIFTSEAFYGCVSKHLVVNWRNPLKLLLPWWRQTDFFFRKCIFIFCPHEHVHEFQSVPGRIFIRKPFLLSDHKTTSQDTPFPFTPHIRNSIPSLLKQMRLHHISAVTKATAKWSLVCLSQSLISNLLHKKILERSLSKGAEKKQGGVFFFFCHMWSDGRGESQ